MLGSNSHIEHKGEDPTPRMDTTTSALLVRAYELISESGISRGSYATDEDGIAVAAGDPRARNFCALGCIQRAAIELDIPTWPLEGTFAKAIRRLYTTLLLTGCDSSPTYWNDYKASDDQVRELVREAAGLPDLALSS